MKHAVVVFLVGALLLCSYVLAGEAGGSKEMELGVEGGVAESVSVADAVVDGGGGGDGGESGSVTGDVGAGSDATVSSASDDVDDDGDDAGSTGGEQSSEGEANDEAGDEVVAQITKELAEVDNLIALSQRKADLLRQLRSALMSGHSIKLDDATRRQWEQAQSATSMRPPASGAQATGSATPPPSSLPKRMQRGRVRTFANSFNKKASITLEDTTVVAVEVVTLRARRPRGSSRRSPLGTVFLVLVATDDGNFRFFDTAGTELLVVPNGHEGVPLSSISADFSDIPTIVSAATDGTVRVATVNAWFDGKLIAGRLPSNAHHGHAPLPDTGSIHRDVLKARREDAGQEAQHVDPAYKPESAGMSLHMSLFAKWHVSEDITAAMERLDDDVLATVPDTAKQGLGAYVTCVQSYHFSRHRMVVVATNTGVLGVHLVNGTMVRSFHYTMSDRVLPRAADGDGKGPPRASAPAPSFNEPITAITRHGAEVAFAVNQNVYFVNFMKPSRRHISTRMCDGAGSEIVSMTFDFISPSSLWVGTAAGDILLYSTRATSRQQQSARCRLMDKVAGIGNAVSVAALRGYLVSLTGATLQVHNSTDVASLGLRWLFDHEVGGSSQTGGPIPLPALSSMSVGSRMSATHQSLMAMASVGGKTVDIHESLLPYHPDHYDIGWIRGPLLAVAVAVVVGYQVLKRRGSSQAGPSVEEIAKTLRVPSATGTSFGGPRERFRRTR